MVCLKKLLFLGYLLPTLVYAQASENYVVDTTRQVHDLAAYTSLYIDSSASKTVQQVAAGQVNTQFRHLSSADELFAVQQTYWLRIPVMASTSLQNWRLLVKSSSRSHPYFARWDHVDVYLVNKAGRIREVGSGGVLTPLSQRSVKEAVGLNAVRLSLLQGEQQTLLIRLQNNWYDGTLPRLELRNPTVGLPTDSLSPLLYVLSAIAAFVCLLSFFFLVFVREKAYLFFSLYLLFLSLHYLILDPKIVFISWFIPEQPQLVFYCFTSLTMGGFMLFLCFGRYFMNLPGLSKRADLFLTGLLALWGALGVAEWIAGPGQPSLMSRPWLSGSLAVLTIGLLIRMALFTSTLARLYVAGALWLLLLSAVGMCWEYGLFDPGFNPWPVAQLGQIVIYMIGLAYKIRLNETARIEAERIKEIDSIKSRFFANISHEFRTPLTLIKGPLTQLEESIQKDGVPLPSLLTRNLKTMRRNTDRLLELVNQLLDLSKLDSKAMHLRVTRGDVIQWIKVLIGSFESLAEQKRIHFHVHYPETTVLGYFDPDKLEKIVANLLGNAFKYTPEGGTIGVYVDIDARRLRLSVDDSGPGMSRSELNQIFDRFYQVEAAENQGSGIGLALVKELMDLYRGQLTVTSEPGKGSRFKISLAIAKEAFQPAEIAFDSSIDNRRIPLPDNGVTTLENTAGSVALSTSDLPLALVIEDNIDLRRFIAEQIGNQYRVLESDTGQAGWQAATTAIPDIIISDVMMPGLTGFQLTEKLKKDERTSHIPVILLTAKAGQQHKLEGLKNGADDYLTKPFDALELLTRLDNLILQRKLLRKKFAGQIILKPSEVTVESADERFLQKVMGAIEEHLGEEAFNVEKLADSVAMSRSQLHRKLQALLDKSPSDLLRQTRLLRAREMLQKKGGAPSEIAYQVGFSSHTYFSRAFREEFGISPSEL